MAGSGRVKCVVFAKKFYTTSVYIYMSMCTYVCGMGGDTCTYRHGTESYD